MAVRKAAGRRFRYTLRPPPCRYPPIDTKDHPLSTASERVGLEMRRQRLELVFRSTRSNQFLSPIVGALLGAALWPVVDHRWLFAWLAVLCAVSVWRYLLARTRQHAPEEPELARTWEQQFLVSLAMASATWGIGAWLLMPAHADAYQVVVYCFVIGMAGGTASIYAAHGPGVAVAIALIMVPSTLYLFSFADAFHVVLATGGLLFVAAASRGTRMMNAAMRRNVELAGELETLAHRDLLSGLHNRRGFTEFGETAIANAVRSGRAHALIMIDIDHFKAVNDRLGHAAGDQVIRVVGRTLARSVRAGECAARIGGEEFAVLLPDADLAQARALGTRILEQIRAMRVDTDSGPAAITVSIGVATGGRPASLDDLLRRADGALYVAKQGGRDRLAVATD